MSDLVKLYTTEAESAEQEIEDLRLQISKIQQNINQRTIEEPSLKVQQLQTDNIKLRHRLAILKRAAGSYQTPTSLKQHDESKMQNILDLLEEVFGAAISKACPTLPEHPVIITVSGTPKFGDYQCNSAMQLSNMYKQNNEKQPPREIANRIIENLPLHPLIEKTEVAGPGFINISISRAFGLKSLTAILQNGVQPPTLAKKHRVVVDFSSPNIAKEMHVGHLRSTIIGESVCRLLEYLGHDVVRVNHVGDWGTQFGMLIAHLKDQFPDYLTKMPPITDLQAFYKASKVRFDEDEAFRKRAYACVVQLQAFEPNYTKAWQLICEISRVEFQKIYDRLDITLEEKGESFYQSRMVEVVGRLQAGGYLVEDEGRKIMWGGEPGEDIPLTVVKSDGGFTYDTSDLATITYRIREEKGDWLIYITDAGQATHFKILFKAARRIGVLTEGVRVDHVQFGAVLGDDRKKFKTRSGETVRLLDLLDEGLKRALAKLMEKERHLVLSDDELKKAQEAVAYGCIKYSDLCHNRNHEYVFSFDKMLEDKGNTAVYLLYAYTRIKSIARNAGLSAERIKELAKEFSVSLEHEKEWKLGKMLLRFPEELAKIEKDLCLHHLCEFVYDVSTCFSEFYDACYCIEKDASGDVVKINYGRILLAETTVLVLEKCFDILGLKPVSKM